MLLTLSGYSNKYRPTFSKAIKPTPVPQCAPKIALSVTQGLSEVGSQSFVDVKSMTEIHCLWNSVKRWAGKREPIVSSIVTNPWHKLYESLEGSF